MAPFTPTVATGMPGGICIIDSIASSPSSIPLIGTPITGNVVDAAITPGRAAAIPAAAMITRMPRPSALRAKFSTASGVRCADKAFYNCYKPCEDSEEVSSTNLAKGVNTKNHTSCADDTGQNDEEAKPPERIKSEDL